MNDASLVRLCLPDPPTPISRAFPRGVRRIREIRIRWVMASCHWTKQRGRFNNVQRRQPCISISSMKTVHVILINVNKQTWQQKDCKHGFSFQTRQLPQLSPFLKRHHQLDLINVYSDFSACFIRTLSGIPSSQFLDPFSIFSHCRKTFFFFFVC